LCSRIDRSTSSDEKGSTPLDFISLLSLSPLGESTDQRKSISLILLCILLLSVLSMFNTINHDSKKAHSLFYISHTPIFIDGDSGFTALNLSTGISSGIGTSSDPYIIEGWEINSWTSDGIHIENTQAHFIVRNCHSYSGVTNSYAGIYLENCTHAVIRDNICFLHDFGIFLHQSSEITIVNNTCSRFIGINLEASSYNLIENNNCSHSYNGISLLYSSTHNTVRGNECNNGSYGIALYESDNNSISDNACNNNHGSFEITYAITLNESANNTLSNNSCQNNDIGIQLGSHSNYNTIINNSCDGGLYGNLVLGYDCDSNSLIHNNCTGGHDGITIYSSGNRVDNNSCSDNVRGIFFGCRGSFLTYIEVTSYDNIVCNNLLSNNSQYGIEIIHASNNVIWNNTFIGNNHVTGSYSSSYPQAYDDGTDNRWNSSEGYGNYWSDWTGPDNSAPFGIVDSPYELAGSTGAKDYSPLTAPHVSITYGAPGLPPLILGGIIIIIAIAILFIIVMRRRKKSSEKPPLSGQ